MKRIIIHALMAIVGATLGNTFLPDFWVLIHQRQFESNAAVNSLIGALIFLVFSFIFIRLLLSFVEKIDEIIATINIPKITWRFLGAVIGLVVGVVGSVPLWILRIPILSTILPFLVMMLTTYIGYSISSRREADILKIFSRKKVLTERAEKHEKIEKKERRKKQNFAKLLDTSVLIDGRIFDILKTGFLDGEIIVPNFVLLEMQILSDSNDNLKRAKGRRGLDLVNNMKEIAKVTVSNKDYDDIHEVDTKLLRYAAETGASLVTNDFNLNKVAEIQGIKVLNINDLANAVKPQLVVGDTLDILIVKKGTERRQGIGYLPDGTMIVVEETADKLDKMVRIEVTKSLQTSAGRMIFGELVR
ncbi:PIN/TRAM domain-containing protein [Lactococcus hodotermopsidis]|uniref:PIN/TRAM domain-containing protein n=1 Tax=Pseudolactococcus hodotermopsidis TaxID=2709157 RepID=A0A6A0BBR1_9LACT|nr:TRAM domain-containing protein [Lactococcus hodotermopsidis]GFH41824.1 PIN/TRAM domain-containing protein [Lactococcus hodotermopsidis]